MRSPTHSEATIGSHSELSFGKDREKENAYNEYFHRRVWTNGVCIPATKQDEDNIESQSWAMAEVTV